MGLDRNLGAVAGDRKALGHVVIAVDRSRRSHGPEATQTELDAAAVELQ